MAKFFEGDLVQVEGEAGKIVKVYETAAGPWYDIETDAELFHSAESDICRPPREEDPYGMDFEISVSHDVAIVRIYAEGKEIAVNHGHIFHPGYAGAVQAVSYAFKRAWDSLKEKEE